MRLVHWSLRFRSPTTVAVASLEAALAPGFGPVTLTQGEWSGNPRDGYFRNWSLEAGGAGPGAPLVLSFAEDSHREESLAPPNTASLPVQLQGASVRELRDRWQALAAALAPLGYVDETPLFQPRRVVLDLEGAGFGAEATALRAAITRALLEVVPAHRSVTLTATCPDDLEAVLAAYRLPEHISTLSLGDCGLSALPPGFARFPNAQHLFVAEPTFDAPALTGWSFPKLRQLSLTGSGTTQVTAAALRGFPALQMLSVANTPLESVEPQVREVCPALTFLHVGGTPLARDPARLEALQASLPGVHVER